MQVVSKLHSFVHRCRPPYLRETSDQVLEVRAILHRSCRQLSAAALRGVTATRDKHRLYRMISEQAAHRHRKTRRPRWLHKALYIQATLGELSRSCEIDAGMDVQMLLSVFLLPFVSLCIRLLWSTKQWVDSYSR